MLCFLGFDFTLRIIAVISKDIYFSILAEYFLKRCFYDHHLR